ncbi:MAG: SGNH/GDSL hydrolase family protein [Planctomycetota bacterium]
MKRLLARLLLVLVVLAVLFGATEAVLRAQGYGAIPSIWFDPRMGTRFHPDQTRDIYAAGNRFMHTAQINGLGLRGDEPDAAAAGDAGLRVVCLGDSFTFGWGVEDGETYPVQLEAALAARTDAPVDVVNCGLPGYNTWQEARAYEAIARPLDPDVVVIGWYLNDLDPLSFGTTGTLAPLDHPLAGTAILDYWVRKLRTGPRHFEFEGLDRERADELKPFYDANRPLVEHNSGHADARPYVERNLRDLGALLDAIEADGSLPIVMVFPSAAQVDALVASRVNDPPEAYEEARATIARIQADVTELARSRDVAVVDLLEPYMDSEVRPYGELDTSHPSVHGYAVAVSALVDALDEAGALAR